MPYDWNIVIKLKLHFANVNYMYLVLVLNRARIKFCKLFSIVKSGKKFRFNKT